MENLKDIIVLYNKDGARINKPLASLMAQMAKNLPAMQETQALSLGQEDSLEIEWQPSPIFLLENPMDRGAWCTTVHGVTKSWTRLSD